MKIGSNKIFESGNLNGWGIFQCVGGGGGGREQERERYNFFIHSSHSEHLGVSISWIA